MSEGSTEPAEQTGGTLRRKIHVLLGTESFLEKALLLVLTAAISGLVVPLVVSYINAQSAVQQKQLDETRAQHQKENDRERTRSEAILQAQARLLREFSEVVLTYVTLALDVSWFGSNYMPNADRHTRALEKYSDRIVDLWSTWRTAISQSHILATPAVAHKMNRMLEEAYSLDVELMKLHSNGEATAAQWTTQHDRNHRFLFASEAIIQELANDLRLTSEQAARQ